MCVPHSAWKVCTVVRSAMYTVVIIATLDLEIKISQKSVLSIDMSMRCVY